MKTRMTNANISELKRNVDAAISAYQKNRPINLQGLIVDATKEKILCLIREKLTPDKFEALVGWYFQKVWATQVISPSKNETDKEGDADIMAIFEPIRTIVYVQAKHHEGETSSWAMQQIKEYRAKEETLDDGYARSAWAVSSCDSYSRDCVKEAKSAGVLLFSGLQFVEMLLRVGFEGIEAAL